MFFYKKDILYFNKNKDGLVYVMVKLDEFYFSHLLKKEEAYFVNGTLDKVAINEYDMFFFKKLNGGYVGKRYLDAFMARLEKIKEKNHNTFTGFF